MRLRGGVHTVPARSRSGWWNELDGKVLSKHQRKEVAVAAGREIARTLKVGHTIDGGDADIPQHSLNEVEASSVKG